jgi:hypothetical protein
MLERLMANMEPEQRGHPTPCWTWTRSCCHKGYGYVTVWCPDRKKNIGRRAHSVSWEIAEGRGVQNGYTLDHLCRNTKCIRPSHLEEVYRGENTARGNRARKKNASTK